jgi:hypothetical protein
MSRILALVTPALLLAACVKTAGETHSLPDSALPLAGLGDIQIETSAPTINPVVVANLKAALEQAARGCGYGPTQYPVHVRIETFKADNDWIQLAGSIRLLSPQTRDVVGEYRIGLVRAGGGSATTGAPETLPRAFADRVCTEILKRRPTTFVTIPQPGGNTSVEKTYRP